MGAGQVAKHGAALLLVLAIAMPFVHWDVVPVMGLGALLALALTRAMTSLLERGADGRRRPEPSGRLSLSVASGLSLAAAAPFAWAARQLLESSPHPDPWTEVPNVFWTPVLVALLAGAYVAATIVVAALRLFPLDSGTRAARVAGGAVLAVTLAMVGLGLVRRVHHVDPDAVRASGEEIARAESSTCWSEAHGVRGLGSVHVETGEKACSQRPEGPANACATVHVDDPQTGERGELPCGTSIWRFRALDLWIVVRGMHVEFEAPDEDAFIGPTFERHTASFTAFAHDLAPPLPWTLVPLAGVAIALLSIAPRDRALRARLDWHEEWRDGIAVLVSPTPERPAGYRESALPDAPTVVEGTRAAVREELTRLQLDRWMFAIAAIVLTATPLYVAAALGFLR